MASNAKPQVVTADADRGVIIANRFCQSVALMQRFDASGPFVTVLNIYVVGFRRLSPRYNVVIIKPASSRLT